MCKNWLCDVRDILYRFNYVWVLQKIDKCIFQTVKQRICDQEKQLIFTKLQEMTKCRIYKHLIGGVYLQYHLKKAIPTKYLKYLTKFRLSSHSLAVETGRYRSLPLCNRFYFSCKDDIQDEFHFILKCPLYETLRKTYIKPFYRNRPSVFKLVMLFTSENSKDMCKLGKFFMESYGIKK